MKNITLLILAPAFLAFSNGPASAKTIERHFQRSFDVGPGAILDLNHGDGRVTIEPWTENRIDVTVDYKASVSGVLTTTPDFTVDFEQQGNRVLVTGRISGVSGIIITTHLSRYTYVVRAPAWAEIHTTGDDGQVEIAGWKGNLDLSMDDGSIRLAAIDADSVSIRIEDGEATLEDISGRLRVRCDDGTVRISDSNLTSANIEIADGNLEVKQSEGDFQIRMDDGNATLSDLRSRRLDIRGEDGQARVRLLPVTNPDFSLTMDDGDIDLSVPGDLSAAFEARADDGSISVKLGRAGDVTKEPHSVTGTLGDGTGRIRLETADGSIVLRQSK
jgi:translation initiation factor IF-1